MTIGKKWPCYGCGENTPTCHSTCSKYLSEKSKHDLEADEARRVSTILGEYISESVRKTKGSGGQLIRNYRPKGRR